MKTMSTIAVLHLIVAPIYFMNLYNESFKTVKGYNITHYTIGQY